jgi:NTP pyrophosphatase (non-canonical NTP hydrolase)
MYPIKNKVDNVENNISTVQTIFDEYQNACFLQKSSRFFCLELNGEAGELANIEKKEWKGKDIPKENFEDEAADVLIALMNYANAKNIDLGKAVKDKLLRIETKRLKLKEMGEDY